jgi:hypothetical protein
MLKQKREKTCPMPSCLKLPLEKTSPLPKRPEPPLKKSKSHANLSRATIEEKQVSCQYLRSRHWRKPRLMPIPPEPPLEKSKPHEKGGML